MNQRNTTPSGNGSEQRSLPPIARARPEAGKSTGDAFVAVARDALDVATELVRDGVSLARLEAHRTASEMMPRLAWGAIGIVCAATALVCAVIAIMLALGAIVPSIAGRLIILALALFVVAFFGLVRAMRPGQRAEYTPASTREPASEEGISDDEHRALHGAQSRSTFLPPTGE